MKAVSGQAKKEKEKKREKKEKEEGGCFDWD